MENQIGQSDHFETSTYQLDDGLYEAVIKDLKNNVSVNGTGTSEIEAYSNALERLEQESNQ